MTKKTSKKLWNSYYIQLKSWPVICSFNPPEAGMEANGANVHIFELPQFLFKTTVSSVNSFKQISRFHLSSLIFIGVIFCAHNLYAAQELFCRDSDLEYSEIFEEAEPKKQPAKEEPTKKTPAKKSPPLAAQPKLIRQPVVKPTVKPAAPAPAVKKAAPPAAPVSGPSKTKEELAKIKELEDLTKNPPIGAQVNERAAVLYNAYREATKAAAEHRQLSFDEPALVPYVQILNDLEQTFKDQKVEPPLGLSHQDLASRYLSATQTVLMYYERWYSKNAPVDANLLPQFRTSFDPSLIGLFSPKDEASKSNFRHLILEEGFKNPAKYLPLIEHLSDVLTSADREWWLGILNDEEKKIFSDRVGAEPEVDENHFVRSLGERPAYQDLVAFKMAMAIYNEALWDRDQSGSKTKLTRNTAETRRILLRDFFTQETNLGNVSYGRAAAGLRELAYRAYEDRELRRVEADPQQRQLYDESKLYSGATDLQMALAKARTQRVREYNDKLDLPSYEEAVLSQAEYQRRDDFEKRGTKRGYSLVAPKGQGIAEVVANPTKLDRVRFMLAAEISDPVLGSTENRISAENAFLLKYSKDELLHLHYLRHFIKDFALQTEKGLHSKEALEEMVRRVRRFESSWNSAFTNPPELKFSSWDDFLANAPDYEAAVAAKDDRYPGIPFEYLALGRDQNRTKLFFDRPEADELPLHLYGRNAETHENVKGILPIPEYRWVGKEVFGNDVQKLFSYADARHKQLAEELKVRLVNAFKEERSNQTKISAGYLAAIDKERKSLVERFQALNNQKPEDREKLSLTQVTAQNEEMGRIRARVDLLDNRKNDWLRTNRGIDESAVLLAGYSFDNWDVYQLEELYHLTGSSNGVPRFLWNKPITRDGKPLLSFLINFNPESPSSALQFSQLRQLIEEHAVFKRMYGQSPSEYIKGRTEENLGTANYLRSTIDERKELFTSLIQDQRFAFQFSPGGRSGEDGERVRFFTPLSVRWMTARRQETIRLLRSKGIDSKVANWEAHLDKLMSDAAERAVRDFQRKKYSGKPDEERKAQLAKLISAELNTSLDLFGEAFLRQLGQFDPKADFKTHFQSPTAANRGKFLETTSVAMVKAMDEDKFDYQEFMEKIGALAYQLQALSHRADANKDRAKAEIVSISSDLLDQISKSKALKGNKQLVGILTAIKTGQRAGYEVKSRTVLMGEYAAETEYYEVPKNEDIDLAGLFASSVALQKISAEMQEKSPAERMRAIYSWIEEDYLRDERELKLTNRDRRDLSKEYNEAVARYANTIGFTQSPRARDQKADEDTTQLFQEEMAGMGKSMLTNWGILGLTYKNTRFISADGVIRNSFQEPDLEFVRDRPELDFKTWFALPQGDVDAKELRVKEDPEGYTKRLLRLVGVLSDDPRRLSNWGREELKKRKNEKGEENFIKLLNSEAWSQHRKTLAEMAKHFFEGGKAVYDSIDKGDALNRTQVLRILELAALDPEGYGKVLTMPEATFLVSGGDRVTESDAEKLLTPAGLWNKFQSLSSSEKKAIRSQLGQLRRYATATELLFRSEKDGDRAAWVDILGQIAAPGFLKEFMLGEGANAPGDFGAGVPSIDGEKKPTRDLRVARDEVLKRRLLSIPDIFGDNTPQSKRVFEEAFEALKSASDEDLEKFWKEFEGYVNSIREKNAKAVEQKFFADGKPSSYYEGDKFAKMGSMILPGMAIEPTAAARRSLESRLKDVPILKDARVSKMLGHFYEGHSTGAESVMEPTVKYWSLAAMAFNERIAVDKRADKLSVSQYSDAKAYANTNVFRATPSDKTYKKTSDLYQLAFKTAFPKMKFIEEQRYQNSANSILDERQAKEMWQARWKHFGELFRLVDPKIAAEIPSSLSDEFFERYSRGLVEPQRFFEDLGGLVGLQIKEAEVLKLAETDPEAFAQFLWDKKIEFTSALNREVILDDLFEGQIYLPDGQKVAQVSKIKPEKMQLAKSLVQQVYKKYREQYLQQFKADSEGVADLLNRDAWLKLLEANPFLKLPVYVPPPVEKKEEVAAPAPDNPEAQAQAILAQVAAQEATAAAAKSNGILSPQMIEAFSLATFDYKTETSAGKTTREQALIPWVQDRLDEYSTPWFKGQAKYDPPYRSRLLVNPNPEVKPADLMPWASYKLVGELLNKSDKYAAGDDIYSGAQNILRSPLLYGTYVEEFLRKLAAQDQFMPEISQRVSREDASLVRQNAERMSRLLSTLKSAPATASLKGEELNRLVMRQLRRAINNTSSVRSQDAKPQGAFLMSSGGPLDRNLALQILVRDEMEEFFNRDGARTSSDWNPSNKQENFDKIVGWILADLTAKNADGSLVDPTRIDKNLATRLGDQDWTKEELLAIATGAGLADSDKLVETNARGLNSDLKKIREIVRANIVHAENKESVAQLEAGRDVIHESMWSLQRNNLYTQLFSLQSQTAQHSKALLDSVRELVRLQQAMGIPMDRILEGMEKMSYEQSLIQVRLAKDRMRRVELAGTNWAYQLLAGTGHGLVVFGEGAFDAIVETGYWVVETPQVLGASWSMTNDQFYRYLQNKNSAADAAVTEGRFSFDANYSGWKRQYYEEDDTGGFLAHHVINAGSVAFVGLKAAKPVLGVGKTAAAMGVRGVVVGGTEASGRMIAGEVLEGGAKGVAGEVLVEGAVQASKQSRLVRILTTELSLGGVKRDVERSSIREAWRQAAGAPKNLALNGADPKRSIPETLRNARNVTGAILLNTVPLTVAMPFIGYMGAGPDEREGYISEAFKEAGRSLGMIPTLMLTHMFLHRLSLKGGGWRFAAYANKNLVSDPLIYYIFREAGKATLQWSYVTGNRVDLWGKNYSYENMEFENGFPKVDPDKPETAKALQEYVYHQQIQAGFLNQLLLMGVIVGQPILGRQAADYFRRSGDYKMANAAETLFGANQPITDEALVGMVRGKYIEGYQSSIRFAPRDAKGNLLNPEQAVTRAHEAGNNQILRFRDLVLDGDLLRQVANSASGNLGVAIKDTVGAPFGQKWGLSAKDQQAIRAKAEELFARATQEGDMSLMAVRRTMDAFKDYKGTNGEFDLKRWIEDRGVGKFMESMNQRYGAGKADWSKLTPEERAREISRVEKMADDLIQGQREGVFGDAIVNLFLSSSEGGALEGALLNQVVTRQLKDVEQGRLVSNAIYGKDLMALWPNLEAYSRFIARLKSFEGGVITLASGESVAVSIREVAREPNPSRDGLIRMTLEKEPGVELVTPDGAPFAHKWRAAGSENVGALDMHWNRVRLEYDGWNTMVTPEMTVRLDRLNNGKLELVEFEYSPKIREPRLKITREGRETTLDWPADRVAVQSMFGEMNLKMGEIPLNQFGGLASEAQMTAATKSGRSLYELRDGSGKPVQANDGSAYAYTWRAESGSKSQLIDIPSMQTRFEFVPDRVAGGVELSRDVVFQTRDGAQIRIRPRRDVHDAEVRILSKGREYVYEDLSKAQSHLKELGIQLRGLSAPEKPMEIAPNSRIDEQTYGYWNKYWFSGKRLRGPEVSAEYSVQYYRMRYKRFGKFVEGWTKVENSGGTLITTYPDASQSFTFYVKPGAREVEVLSILEEAQNQKRLAEGLTGDEASLGEAGFITPRTTLDGASANRVEARRAEKFDPIEGTEYTLRLPPKAEGELRYVIPTGDRRGEIHLVDRNGVETIISPNSRSVEFKWVGTNNGPLAPISIRTFMDVVKGAGMQGSSVSEVLMAHVINDRMALRYETLTGIPSVARLKPSRATAFDLNIRMDTLQIPITGNFQTKSAVDQGKIIREAEAKMVEYWNGKPASSLVPENLVMVHLHAKELLAYVEWVHGGRFRFWARPEKNPDSDAGGPKQTSWWERWRSKEKPGQP